MEKIIRYKGFLHWLERGEMHAVAGLAGHAYKCPVALWLGTLDSSLRVQVTYLGVICYRDDESVDAWQLDTALAEFIDQADELGQKGNGGLWDDDGEYYHLTYAQCKRVLHGILADIQSGSLGDE